MRSASPIPIRVALATVLALAVTAAACGDGAVGDGDGLRVIASTSILGDIAANIAGDGAVVEVLVPPGGDPHSFQASARQAAALTAADLVIVNGMGLETALQPVLAAARSDGANVLEVGPRLDPIPAGDGSATRYDPHVWLDPLRMTAAVDAIAAALAARADGDWQQRASDYRAALEATAAEMERVLAAVPPDRRRLVTNHDSLAYFAARFGFEIVGVVIPGGNPAAAASAADLEALVALITAERVPALFTDAELPDSVAEAIAAEIGSDFALVPLYTGSLGPPGSGAETYLDMLLLNARRIAAALGAE